jgi:hypothetical protein
MLSLSRAARYRDESELVLPLVMIDRDRVVLRLRGIPFNSENSSIKNIYKARIATCT